MGNIMIKARNICKSFNDGKRRLEIIKNIDLDIVKEDFTVVMGSSGSGKSTLLYLLSSMDKVTSGEVDILGKKTSTMNERQLSQIRKSDISFVFQSINLIPDLTAFENIAYPAYMVMSKHEANMSTETILERFGLLDQKNKYPNEMSGGQQQRIAIGRAIVTNPKVLFADEPTGSLNSGAGIQVLDLLTDLNKSGQSIVMVTHDIKASARGNRLIYLRDGKIINELNMGKYSSKDQEAREKQVFEFLKKNDW